MTEVKPVPLDAKYAAAIAKGLDTAFKKAEEQPSESPGIVISDEQRLTRFALRRCLEDAGFTVVGETGNVESTLHAAAGHIQIDVLVLDIERPENAARRLVAQILQLSPQTAIVGLASRPQRATARAVLQAGARAYLIKDTAQDELPIAIGAVAAGRRYVDPHWAACFLVERQSDGDELTRRQREILGLLALGYTNAHVARKLSISVRTVESHRAQIQERLKRYTRAALVSYAIERGLVPWVGGLEASAAGDAR